MLAPSPQRSRRKLPVSRLRFLCGVAENVDPSFTAEDACRLMAAAGVQPMSISFECATQARARKLVVGVSASEANKLCSRAIGWNSQFVFKFVRGEAPALCLSGASASPLSASSSCTRPNATARRSRSHEPYSSMHPANACKAPRRHPGTPVHKNKRHESDNESQDPDPHSMLS